MNGNQKIPIKEAIIVEGRYDKAKVSRIFDTVIIETAGFGVFSDKQRADLIKKMAKTRGVIILTDSDGAGFIIRNYLKNILASFGEKVKHAYIPDVYGKERRKTEASAEGKLGVEGIDDEIIIDAVLKAGAQKEENIRCDITKTVLYEDGFNGREQSAQKRAKLLKKLGLPEHLSMNALCDVLNGMMTLEEYKRLIAEI